VVRQAAKAARKPARERARRVATGGPFSVEHFRSWCSELTLDNGEPFLLEPFQESFVDDVFAGTPECWLVVPEGCGKSTLIAALVLYHLEFHPSADAVWAASSRDQAQVGYRCAAGFVARSERLGAMFTCLAGYRRIRMGAEGGPRLQIFSADERTGDGVLPTLCVLDELHRQKGLGLYRTWSGKLGKRKGQIVVISTAGAPDSEFEVARVAIRQASVTVERSADGTFVRSCGPQVVMHEWSVPEGGDTENIELVAKANPLSTITVTTLRAKRSSPTMTDAHWRRHTCNLPTRASVSAIIESEWDAAETSDRIPEGVPIWLGVDVGWRQDATALVPLWWKHGSARLLGAAVVLQPPGDGTSLSVDRVKAALLEVHARNPIQTTVMDTYQAMDVADWIETRIGCEVVQFKQSLTMHVAAYRSFMAGLRERKLWHSGDRVLRRHTLNAVERVLPQGDSCFARPSSSRQGDQSGRAIDALVAATMVHHVAQLNGEADSVYVLDTRGV
jgi:phage terminase large subunit-like protein